MSGKRESRTELPTEALSESGGCRDIFETSTVGFYRTTPDGRILTASPALLQMLGYSTFQELAHRNLEEEGYEPDYPRSAFKERIESEGQIVGLESAWVRRDGTTLFVRESARVIRDDAGDTLYYEGTVEDIGVSKRAEEALREAHAELERRVEERTAELMAANKQLRQAAEDRKRAEKTLRETTRLLETILDHTHMLVAYMDPDFNFVRVNRAYAEADQREPSFFPGKNHFDLYPGEENEAIFRTVVETGEPYVAYARPFEYAEHPERGITYWDWTLVPIKESGGTVTGLVLTLADVTERKRAEQALWKSEERHRDLVESIEDVIYALDADSEMTYVSPSIEAFGYSPAEVVGHTFAEFMVPEDLRTARESLQRLFAGQSVGVNEYRILSKSGEMRWVRVSSRPLLTDDRVVGVRGVLSDITERKRAEEALEASEERYRAVVEDMPALVCRFLPDGTLTLVNEQYCEYFGKSREELEGHNFFDFIPEEERKEVLDRYSSLTPESPVTSYEHQVLVPDGTLRWQRWTDRALFDDGTRAVEYQSIGEDVTERKRAERQLLQAKEAAEAARRAEEERRQEAVRRRDIAEALADVMSVLNSNQTLDEVLDYLTLQSERLLDNQAVAIYRLEDDGRLSVQAAQSLLLTYVVGREMPLGQQALQQAIASGKAVTVSHLGAQLAREGEPPGDAESEALARTWADLYQALLAVPITVGDEPYGGIALYYTEPRDFPEEEVELATVFGDQVALAIENARLRDQVQETAAIAERERLARDLHDAVTQTLFSASLIAETLPRIWERNPTRAEEGLEELRKLTQGALAEMRTLLLELRPAALTEKPLGEILGDLTQAMTSRSRIPVTLTVEGDSFLPAEQQIALYRIAQEALNNVAKHAAATEVSVHLCCQPERVALSIQDDGRGFDASQALPDQLGLRIMRERAETIGAALEISSEPGHGTQVSLDWVATARGKSNE